MEINAINWMENASGLSEIELIWLLMWNIAAGNWDRVGLPPESASELFFDFVAKLSGDPLTLLATSRSRLQRALAASQRGASTDISREAPFDPTAEQNFESLLIAWRNRGRVGLAETWQAIFSCPAGSGENSRAGGSAGNRQPESSGGLSSEELAWLAVWNAISGEWQRIGLARDEARDLVIHFLQCMKMDSDMFKVVENSAGQLQQRMMALRRGSFEAIQEEAPFSRWAKQNFLLLVRTWNEEGEKAVKALWNEIFANSSKVSESTTIRVIGGPGGSEDDALEVIGAADQETRVAAEWWWLFYTHGRNWTPVMHMTLQSEDGRQRFSVHEIEETPNRHKRLYFRVPSVATAAT